MAQEWWKRLPAEDRREYQRSAGISRVALPADPDFAPTVEAIDKALKSNDQHAVEFSSQALADRINLRLQTPRVTIRVEGQRPPDGEEELHGIYVPGEDGNCDRICVWMHTAKRGDVVAVRSFLRTLLHEIGHHIDFHLLELPNSFHTKGFYQRESSLFRAVTSGSALGSKQTSRSAPAKTPPEKPSTNPKPDVERGLALLRAAAAEISQRSRRP